MPRSQDFSCETEANSICLNCGKKYCRPNFPPLKCEYNLDHCGNCNWRVISANIKEDARLKKEEKERKQNARKRK